MNQNGDKSAADDAALFERIAQAHDLRDRLYRVVDLDELVWMVLCEATPETFGVIEAFVARLERKAAITQAIKAHAA